MNNKNGNLFSTFLPIKFRNIFNNIFPRNSSQTELLKNKVNLQFSSPTFKETTMKKTNNEESLSFSPFSDRNKNYNMYKTLLLCNNNNNLKNINENCNNIPLTNQTNNRNNINRNFSNSNIQPKKGTISSLKKKIFSSQNPIIYNNFLFNKRKNFYSKDNINYIKYMNFKNLNSKFKLNKIKKDILIKKNNNKTTGNNVKKYEILIRNNINKEELNNYLTIYNLKSFSFDNQIKKKIKIEELSKQNSNYFTLYKNYSKNKNNEQIKTFFPNNSLDKLLIPKKILNNNKFIKEQQSTKTEIKRQFKIKRKENKNKILIEAISIPGTTLNKEKINQDTYMILPNNKLTEDAMKLKIFGIFDGHGEYGDIISNEVKNYFIEYFSKLDCYSDEIYDKLCKNNYKELFTLFDNIDKKLHNKYKLKKTCFNSGTTAHLVLLFQNKILSINLGNSKSILIYEKNNNLIQLNICHNPEMEEEKKRIEKNGGEIGRVDWADYGPQRIWYKGRNYPGLSISRSFGDFISEPLGVFSIPDIKEYNFEIKKAKMLVIATDGIWEFLSNEKVKDILIPFYEENNINGAMNKLINVATKFWKIKNPEFIDDLSSILIFFK